MKKMLIKISWILLLVFSGSHAWAQSMSLDIYLDSLQQNSIHLQQSRNSVNTANVEMKISRASLLPSVGISTGYQRDFNRSYMFISDSSGEEMLPDKFPMNFYNNINAAIVAEQTIIDFSASSQLKLAKIAGEYAELSHQDLSQELIKRATLLYWNALYAKASLEVMNENVELAKQQAEQVSIIFEQGVVSEFEKQQAEIYYRQTLPLLQSTKNMYQNLLNELKVLANIHSNTFDIEGEIAVSGDISTTDYPLNNVLKNNMSIARLNKQLELSQQQVKTGKASYYPSLKAQLGYAYDSYDDKFKFENDNSVGFAKLTLSIPIFTGGYNKSNVKLAQIQVNNAQLAYDYKKLELQKDLSNAQNDLNVAVEKINSETQLIELSERELEIAEEKIKLGIITNVEAKEIRVALIKAKLSRLNACLDYRAAHITIKKIIGVL
jgi:outer membrane protein TolC